eukprot:scaffold15670_cov112-Isochrysis_galbana.AAC.16
MVASANGSWLPTTTSSGEPETSAHPPSELIPKMDTRYEPSQGKTADATTSDQARGPAPGEWAPPAWPPLRRAGSLSSPSSMRTDRSAASLHMRRCPSAETTVTNQPPAPCAGQQRLPKASRGRISKHERWPAPKAPAGSAGEGPLSTPPAPMGEPNSAPATRSVLLGNLLPVHPRTRGVLPCGAPGEARHVDTVAQVIDHAATAVRRAVVPPRSVACVAAPAAAPARESDVATAVQALLLPAHDDVGWLAPHTTPVAIGVACHQHGAHFLTRDAPGDRIVATQPGAMGCWAQFVLIAVVRRQPGARGARRKAPG